MSRHGSKMTGSTYEALSHLHIRASHRDRGPVAGNGGIVVKHGPACTALVKQFEGCVLKAYPDPGSGNDPWTCGWGATGCDVERGVIWTQDQADARLEFDLAEKAAGVAKLIGKVATKQHEFDALVSFAFNVGLANLAKSTLLRLHNAGDKTGAALQFARWNRAAGRVMRGLTRRRMAEAALYRGQS
jgi:lysozyme